MDLNGVDNRAFKERFNELTDELAACEDDNERDRLVAALEHVKNETFLANRGLIATIAKAFVPFNRSNEDFEDYLGAGNVAFWEAFLSWDPTRSSLAHWAYARIDGAVRRQVAHSEYGGSYHDWCNRPKVAKATTSLQRRLGRTPTQDEVAVETNLTVQAVDRASRSRAVSLDTPIGDDITVGDLLPDTPTDRSSAVDELSQLDTMLADLPADQLALLLRCRGDELVALDGGPVHTVAAAASVFGFNRESGRERLNKALGALGA